MKMKLHILFSLIWVLLVLSCSPEESNNDIIISPDNIQGSLTIDNGVRILALRGSSYEKGYAHGYLLATEIIEYTQNFIVYHANDRGLKYSILRDYMSKIDWGNYYGTEIEGMYAGINDKLSSDKRMITVDNVGREIQLVDLQILNSVSDWGCSSFSAWGSAREDGSVVYARNLDYHRGKDDALKKAHVIISYENENKTNWVTASFCGSIGCVSGMNEHGMTMALHDSDYFSSSDETGFIPRTSIVRKLMEESQPTWTPADIESLMDTYPVYVGMNLHVTFPSSENRIDNDIASLIEFDGNANHTDGRATLRRPSDNSGLPNITGYSQNLDYTNVLINTNHYLKRKPDVRDENEGGDSGWRYHTIKEGIDNAKSDGNITVDEALNILRPVGTESTIHTVVFESGEMMMHFYLAVPGKGGYDSPGVSYEFESLF